MVRYALDLYAMEEALRQYEDAKSLAPIEKVSQSFSRVEKVLEYYESQIPEKVYSEIQEKILAATELASITEARTDEEIGLLGALATAGIAALAYQHELNKQFSTIRDIILQIEQLDTDSAQRFNRTLSLLARDLSNWVERAEATNALFDYLADAENIQTRQRFRALLVLKDIKQQTRFLARGIEVDVSQVDPGLYLPEATLPEWGAIFQNVLTNAFNAMIDSDRRLLQVSSYSKGTERGILVQDTGYGIDLNNAEKWFQPFKRASKISKARQALGYGGTGLGLTIVRLLSSRVGCIAEFVEPDGGFNTAFSLSWRERQ
jgi:C4-dicarboxylate-specific signal transduction histidine kinase